MCFHVAFDHINSQYQSSWKIYCIPRKSLVFDHSVTKKEKVTKNAIFYCENKAMKIVRVLMLSSLLTRRACHLTFVCPNCFLCHKIFSFKVYLEDTDDMALCLSQLFDSSKPGFQSYFYHLAPMKT